jgi:hypothetical protein
MDSTSTHTNYGSPLTNSSKPFRVLTALLRLLKALSRPQRALIWTPSRHSWYVRDLLETRSTLTLPASSNSYGLHSPQALSWPQKPLPWSLQAQLWLK